MLLEILSEPVLAFGLGGLWLVTGAIAYLTCKSSIKKTAAKIASACLSKTPEWGQNEEGLELCLDSHSHKKIISQMKLDFEQKTQKLESKINRLERHLTPKNCPRKVPLEKGIIIKIGKFRQATQIPHEILISKFQNTR